MTTTPWACTGGSQIAQGTAITNPQPQQPSTSGPPVTPIGQISSLPWTVPAGKRLCIDMMYFEAYSEDGGASNCGLGLLGGPSCTGNAYTGTKQLTDLGLYYDEGFEVSIWVSNQETNTGTGGVFAWGLTGFLEDKPV